MTNRPHDGCAYCLVLQPPVIEAADHVDDFLGEFHILPQRYAGLHL
ncbi:MAG: hypothetical protein IKU04_05440 [Bacteroidales bacterium]|nr:hypothetical protein [Bacteroidales bacterium]